MVRITTRMVRVVASMVKIVNRMVKTANGIVRMITWCAWCTKCVRGMHRGLHWAGMVWCMHGTYWFMGHVHGGARNMLVHSPSMILLVTILTILVTILTIPGLSTINSELGEFTKMSMWY